MRAMVFDRYGEPDVLRLRDVPVPRPQDGEVLIRVGYAGVNPSDSKARLEDAAPGLSQQISDLEDELRIKQFTRNSRVV